MGVALHTPEAALLLMETAPAADAAAKAHTLLPLLPLGPRHHVLGRWAAAEERPQAEGAGPQAAAVAGPHTELLRVGSRHQVGVALLHTLRMPLQPGPHTLRPRVGLLHQGTPRVVVAHHTEGVERPRLQEHLRGAHTGHSSSSAV